MKDLVMYSKNDIAKIKQIILKIVTPEEIILFGSYARGDFKKESDLDFLIVMREELTRIEKNKIRNSLALQFFDYNYNVLHHQQQFCWNGTIEKIIIIIFVIIWQMQFVFLAYWAG